jgi:hypothetical protein
MSLSKMTGGLGLSENQEITLQIWEAAALRTLAPGLNSENSHWLSDNTYLESFSKLKKDSIVLLAAQLLLPHLVASETAEEEVSDEESDAERKGLNTFYAIRDAAEAKDMDMDDLSEEVVNAMENFSEVAGYSFLRVFSRDTEKGSAILHVEMDDKDHGVKGGALREGARVFVDAERGRKEKAVVVRPEAVQALGLLAKKLDNDESGGGGRKRKATSGSGGELGEGQAKEDLDGNLVECNERSWMDSMRKLMHLKRLMPGEVFEHLFPNWKFDSKRLTDTFAANSGESEEDTYLSQFQRMSLVKELAVVADPELLEKLILAKWNIVNFSMGMLSLRVFLPAGEGELWLLTKKGSMIGRSNIARAIKGLFDALTVFINPAYYQQQIPILRELEDTKSPCRASGDEFIFVAVGQYVARYFIDTNAMKGGGERVYDGEERVDALAEGILSVLRNGEKYPHNDFYNWLGVREGVTLGTASDAKAPLTGVKCGAQGVSHGSQRGMARPLKQTKTSSAHCAFHVAGLLGVRNSKEELYTCKPQGGEQCNCRHVTTVTEVTLEDVEEAVEVSDKMHKQTADKVLSKARHGGC